MLELSVWGREHSPYRYCLQMRLRLSSIVSIRVSACRCSSVGLLWHPVAILRAEFCIVWSFLRFMGEVFGDQTWEL